MSTGPVRPSRTGPALLLVTVLAAALAGLSALLPGPGPASAAAVSAAAVSVAAVDAAPVNVAPVSVAPVDAATVTSGRAAPVAFTGAGGTTHDTLRTVPGVRRNPHVTLASGDDRPDGRPADYADAAESAGIQRLATDLPAASADPAPPQDLRNRALDPLPWYASTWFEAVATLFCLTGFAGYALTGAVRRPRRRPRPAALPRAARWAALSGAAAVLGALGYLLFLVLTAAMFPGPVLFGRPVVWLAVQLLALFALGAAAVAAAGDLVGPPGAERGELGQRGPLSAAGGARVVVGG
ncbi:hypothetical protein ABZW03_24535, partial [Kitasatospora sp. NPDC004799]